MSMYSRFDVCISQYADDEVPTDYWSDVEVVNASGILEEFSDTDWSELLAAVNGKSEFWILRMCESMGSVADERALAVLLDLMFHESETVRYAALDAIRSMTSSGVEAGKCFALIASAIERAKQENNQAGRVSVLNLEHLLTSK
ncbi:HEAT repeat domain-containing protein [Pseudomonas allokribbensis]|uniref:HEAT repeat domain-containing protein n=1 Tax=Pseudomonas allokribbensis TaxID=2774460 RepID=UPI00178871FD|nr:HEAT repeat domain-containing protein [Pseudomonas allokribbensis]